MEPGTVGGLHLDEHGVQYTPSHFRRWRGRQARHLPYAAITGISMTEPHGLTRGVLSVRLRREGEELRVPFGEADLTGMRLLQEELWRRAKAAREAEADQVE